MEQTAGLLMKPQHLAHPERQSAYRKERPHTVHGYTSPPAAIKQTHSVYVEEYRPETFLKRQRGHHAPPKRRQSNTSNAQVEKKEHGCCWHLFCDRLVQMKEKENALSEDVREDRQLIRKQYFCPAIMCSIVFPPLGIPALVLASEYSLIIMINYQQ